MASRLGQAARRLGQQQWRGLANALAEGGMASSSSNSFGQQQQPVVATRLRAHSSSTAAGGNSSNLMPAAAAEALKLSEAARASTSGAAASSSSSQQQAHSEASAAAAAKVPEGSTDFSKKQLMMIFTCNKCNTRAAKAFSKQSYEKGVVIVECPGCKSKHLIADNLGWWGQKGTVEDFAAEKGSMVVRKLADGTMELTPEDILGRSSRAATAAPEQTEEDAAAAPAAAAVGTNLQ